MTETQDSQLGKGKATPSRKQQEAANRRPLVGDKSKEARAAEKARLSEERRIAREGMMRGEEKYLPIRDRGPQKRFAREVVDSRFTAGELVMPAMFIFLITTATNIYALQLASLILMWGLFVVVIIDALILGRRVKKLSAQKYTEANVEKGIAWYAAMRSLQMRPMRLPKPQVKRGHKL
jgi:Flp pilus assembly protein TadB